MTQLLAVFIGGGIGSLLRWIVCTRTASYIGTFTVNILGAFFIGLCAGWLAQKTSVKPEVKLFLMTGLLGGFTTFSTYLLDFTTLVMKNNWLEAILYLTLSVFIGLLLLAIGFKITHTFF